MQLKHKHKWFTVLIILDDDLETGYSYSDKEIIGVTETFNDTVSKMQEILGVGKPRGAG